MNTNKDYLKVLKDIINALKLTGGNKLSLGLITYFMEGSASNNTAVLHIFDKAPSVNELVKVIVESDTVKQIHRDLYIYCLGYCEGSSIDFEDIDDVPKRFYPAEIGVENAHHYMSQSEIKPFDQTTNKAKPTISTGINIGGVELKLHVMNLEEFGKNTINENLVIFPYLTDDIIKAPYLTTKEAREIGLSGTSINIDKKEFFFITETTYTHEDIVNIIYTANINLALIQDPGSIEKIDVNKLYIDKAISLKGAVHKELIVHIANNYFSQGKPIYVFKNITGWHYTDKMPLPFMFIEQYRINGTDHLADFLARNIT